MPCAVNPGSPSGVAVPPPRVRGGGTRRIPWRCGGGDGDGGGGGGGGGGDDGDLSLEGTVARSTVSDSAASPQHPGILKSVKLWSPCSPLSTHIDIECREAEGGEPWSAKVDSRRADVGDNFVQRLSADPLPGSGGHVFLAERPCQWRRCTVGTTIASAAIAGVLHLSSRYAQARDLSERAVSTSPLLALASPTLELNVTDCWPAVTSAVAVVLRWVTASWMPRHRLQITDDPGPRVARSFELGPACRGFGVR